MSNLPDPRSISKWFHDQFPNKTTDEVWTSFRDLAYGVAQTKPVGDQMGQFDTLLAKTFKQLVAESTNKNHSENQFYDNVGKILEKIQKIPLQQLLKPGVSKQVPQPLPQQPMPNLNNNLVSYVAPMPMTIPQQNIVIPQKIQQPTPPKGPTVEMKNRFDKLRAEYKLVFREWVTLCNEAKKKSSNAINEGLEKAYKQANTVLTQFDTPDWNTIDKASLDIIENTGKKMQQKLLEVKVQKAEKMKAEEKKLAYEKMKSEEKKNVETKVEIEKIVEKEVVSHETQGFIDRLSAMEREKNDRLMKIVEKFGQIVPTTRGEKRKEFISLPVSSKKSKHDTQYTFHSLQLELNTLDVKKISEGVYQYQSKVIPKKLIITLNTNESIDVLFTIEEYNANIRKTSSLQFNHQWTLSQCIQTYDRFVTFLNQVERQVNCLTTSSFFQYNIGIDASINKGDIVVTFEQLGKIKIPDLILILNSERILNVTFDQVIPDESNRCFAEIRGKFEKAPWNGVNFLMNQWITSIDEFYKHM